MQNYVSNTKKYQNIYFTITNSTYLLAGSVGKSADSAFLSASVDDPDDAFVGFTYVPPTDEIIHEWKQQSAHSQYNNSAQEAIDLCINFLI